MLLGRAGTLHGPLAPELVELAESLRGSMKGIHRGYLMHSIPTGKRWKTTGGPGPDEEELFELAMHDRQYRDYKSGVAQKKVPEGDR